MPSIPKSRAVIALVALCWSLLAVAAMDEEWAEAGDPDYTAAVKAIEMKNFPLAVTLLTNAAARNDHSADIYNLLGYAERKRGNLETAFAHYARALELDPKHRGAHEYVGEAYLTEGNLAKAQEHLAALDKICFMPCKEYTELKRRIAEYQAKQ